MDSGDSIITNAWALPNECKRATAEFKTKRELAWANAQMGKKLLIRPNGTQPDASKQKIILESDSNAFFEGVKYKKVSEKDHWNVTKVILQFSTFFVF